MLPTGEIIACDIPLPLSTLAWFYLYFFVQVTALGVLPTGEIVSGALDK
jgi:hypothetical protein